MKKIAYSLTAICLLFTMLTQSSCSEDDGVSRDEVIELINQKQETADFLIGIWTSSNRYGFTFNEDGTGQWWYAIGTTSKRDMTWAYDNGILAIYMNIEAEGWYMFTVTKLSDKEIIIGQGTRTAVYTKQ